MLGLSKRIVQSQEIENRWVARELHDNVNQILSSLKFRIESAKLKAAKKHNPIFEDLVKSGTLVETAIVEIRRISRKLKPTVLDDLGLLPAVESLCDDYRERCRLSIDLRVTRLHPPLPNEFEVTLYRILQEAMSNIEKHSEATRVTIDLYTRKACVCLKITDNGRGFDTGKAFRATFRSGLGLRHIRERAMFMGGDASVVSTPSEGTEICVRIPLKRRATDKKTWKLQ